MHSKGRSLFLLAVLLLLLPWGLPAMAQTAPSPIRVLDIDAMLAGHYKLGEWVAIRIAVEAQGPVTVTAKASVADQRSATTYVREATLPAAGREELILYALPLPHMETLSVQIEADGELIAAQSLNLTPHTADAFLAGVIAPDPAPYELMQGIVLGRLSRGVQIVALDWTDLAPDPLALRSLDALIVDLRTARTLGAQHLSLLERWIAIGGHLVVVGGDAAQGWERLSPRLRPEEVASVSVNDLTPLARFSATGLQAPAFDGQLTVPSYGRPLLEVDGRGWITWATIGRGRVTYLAWDPAAEPFASWAGMRAVWAQVLRFPGGQEPFSRSDISTSRWQAQQMTFAVTRLPWLSLPSLAGIVALLVFYVLLVGPLTYLLLRRWRRLDWAWVTTPALALAFTAAVLGVGSAQRGREPIVMEQTIVDALGGGDVAVQDSYVALFSPRRGVYTLKLDDEGLVSPLAWAVEQLGSPLPASDLTLVQGDGIEVQGLAVEPWGLQSVRVEKTLVPAPAVVDGELSFVQNRIEGVIRNRRPVTLTDVVLFVGSRYGLVEDLAPGEERALELELRDTNLEGMPFPYGAYEASEKERLRDRQREHRQMVVSNLWSVGGVNFWSPRGMALGVMAWTDERLTTAQVPGEQVRHVGSTLWLARLPVRLPGGKVILGPGMISSAVLEVSGDVGQCGPGAQVYLGATGQAVVEFILPEIANQLELTSLTISVHSLDSRPASLSMELYDWTMRMWVPVQLRDGATRVEDEPARFVNGGSGQVQVRVRPGTVIGTCIALDLSVDAQTSDGR